MPSWQSTSRIGCLVNNPTRRSRGTISPVRLQWTRVSLDFRPRWRYVVDKAGAANAAPALKYKFYFTSHFGGYTEFGIVPSHISIEYLRLVHHPTKGSRMHNSISITLEGIPFADTIFRCFFMPTLIEKAAVIRRTLHRVPPSSGISAFQRIGLSFVICSSPTDNVSITSTEYTKVTGPYLLRSFPAYEHQPSRRRYHKIHPHADHVHQTSVMSGTDRGPRHILATKAHHFPRKYKPLQPYLHDTNALPSFPLKCF